MSGFLLPAIVLVYGGLGQVLQKNAGAQPALGRYWQSSFAGKGGMPGAFLYVVETATRATETTSTATVNSDACLACVLV